MQEKPVDKINRKGVGFFDMSVSRKLDPEKDV